MYFKHQINVKVTYQKEEYALECRVEHMLISKDTWLYFCDKYGRTGTSQCFGALRFKVEGFVQEGMLTTDGMKVTAISPSGKETEVKTLTVTVGDQTTSSVQRSSSMVILERDSDRLDKPLDRSYSIVNLTSEEFFAISDALKKQYYQSAPLDSKESFPGEADRNVAAYNNFREAFSKRVKME